MYKQPSEKETGTPPFGGLNITKLIYTLFIFVSSVYFQRRLKIDVEIMILNCLGPRMERGRKRQELCPEFKLRVPVMGRGAGQTEIVLAELKCISCCPTGYPRDPC